MGSDGERNLRRSAPSGADPLSVAFSRKGRRGVATVVLNVFCALAGQASAGGLAGDPARGEQL